MSESEQIGSMGDSDFRRGSFPTTQWSIVLRARQSGDTQEFKSAADRLYRAYWYPLYAYARRWRNSPHDAQDLTQGFFAYALEKDFFADADAGKGKLRNFLMTAFSRYAKREFDRDQAEKRGGGRRAESLDEQFGEGEQRYQHEPADLTTPATLFDRAWAQSILDAAKARLAANEAASGRAELYKALEPFLERGHSSENPYKELATRLGLKEPTLRKTVERLRDRYREAVRAEIANTLTNPTDQAIDEEARCLRAAFDT
jgi:RNA polymerase sigma factor (sigma-70 family)